MYELQRMTPDQLEAYKRQIAERATAKAKKRVAIPWSRMRPGDFFTFEDSQMQSVRMSAYYWIRTYDYQLHYEKLAPGKNQVTRLA